MCVNFLRALQTLRSGTNRISYYSYVKPAVEHYVLRVNLLNLGSDQK